MKERSVANYTPQEKDIGLDATVFNTVSIKDGFIGGIYNQYSLSTKLTNEEGNDEACFLTIPCPKENSVYDLVCDFSGSPYLLIEESPAYEQVPPLPAWKSSKASLYHDQIVVGRYIPQKGYFISLWRESKKRVWSFVMPFNETDSIELLANFDHVIVLLPESNLVKVIDIASGALQFEATAKLNQGSIRPLTLKQHQLFYAQSGVLYMLDLNKLKAGQECITNLGLKDIVNTYVSDDGKTIYAAIYQGTEKVTLAFFDIPTLKISKEIQGEIVMNEEFHHWIIHQDQSVELIQVPHLKRWDNFKLFEKYLKRVNEATSQTDPNEPLQEYILTNDALLDQ
jgi:hypothetical protein